MSQEEFPSSPLKPIDELVTASGAIPVLTESAFEAVLKLEHSIVYLLVNWSGQERFSRYCVFGALAAMDGKGVPLYWIDCSENGFWMDWVERVTSEHAERMSGGCGETLRLRQGMLVDMIVRPDLLGVEKTRLVLEKWIRG